MGKSTAEVIEMSSKGELLAENVLPALVDGMENKFGGAMDKQSASFSGMISTMQDGWQILMGKITEGLFGLLKGVLPKIIDAMDKLIAIFEDGTIEAYFSNVGSILQEVGDMILPIFMPIIDMVKTIGKAFMDAFSNIDMSVWENISSGIKDMVTVIIDTFTTISSAVAPVIAELESLWINFLFHRGCGNVVE